MILSKTNSDLAAERAATALSRIGKEAFPVILSSFTNAPQRFPRTMIACLRNMNRQGVDIHEAIPTIFQISTNSDFLVSINAIRTLRKLGQKPEALIPLLTNRLESQDHFYLKSEALKVISEFGKDAKPALPAIIPLLTNAKRSMREAATNTIRVIAPEYFTNSAISEKPSH